MAENPSIFAAAPLGRVNDERILGQGDAGQPGWGPAARERQPQLSGWLKYALSGEAMNDM